MCAFRNGHTDGREPVPEPLRILLLEDNEADGVIVQATLEDGGIACDIQRVETRASFTAALEQGGFDLILSDLALPSFDGFSALRLVRAEKQLETPFIFVSGTIGEETAIESLHNGATDYVLKQRLSRLVPAVCRAVAEAGQLAARRQADASRRKAETMFQALFEQAAIGVALTTLDGWVVRSNAAFRSMLGYQDEELIGRPVSLLYMEEPAGAVGALELERDCGGSCRFEGKLRRKDGAPVLVRVGISVLRQGGDPPEHLIQLFEDVTGLRALEEQLLHARNLEIVGRLGASVAHDFQNYLTIINGYARMLLEASAESAPERRQLSAILNAGQRARTLTGRLLTLSRQQVRKPGPVEPNQMLAGMGSLLQGLVGERIRLVMALDPQVGWIEADPMEIEQAVMNLATNARDAMMGGGKLTIETRPCWLREQAAQALGVQAGEFVELSIADTGQGMDEATRARVFTPFFTTKEVGKGTGLGLWSLRKTVRECGGGVAIDSVPGSGTRVRIYLPRVEPAAGPVAVQAPQAAEAALVLPVRGAGAATILVADDDPAIRTFLGDILVPLGYRMLEAADGLQAMERLRGEAVELLITDLIMPGQEGMETIRKVREEQPDLRIVAMSGGFGASFLTVAQRLGAHQVLYKPFSADEVRNAVERVLAGEPAGAGRE